MPGLFRRAGHDAGQNPITLICDGAPIVAAEGDTVLTALLLATDHVRMLEFGGERRAGFCLMGACQDCFVWGEDGERMRACTTPARDGMRLSTRMPSYFGELQP